MQIHDYPYFTEYHTDGKPYQCSFFGMTFFRIGICALVFIASGLLWLITGDAFYHIKALCLYATYTGLVMFAASVINFVTLTGKMSTWWFTGFVIQVIVVVLIMWTIFYYMFINLDDVSGPIIVVCLFILVAMIPITGGLCAAWLITRHLRKQGGQNVDTEIST